MRPVGVFLLVGAVPVVFSQRRVVPEIVNAGTSPRPAVGDAGLPEEPAEVLVDVPQRQRLAGLGPGKNQSQPGCPATCAR